MSILQPLILMLVALCVSCATIKPESIESAAETQYLQLNSASEKFAIVVGISKYDYLPPLDYAANDAILLGQRLEALGYTVKVLTDFGADQDRILKTVNDIGKQMDSGNGRESGSLVFAFSGHGYRQDGINFLATTETNPQNIRGTSLSVQRVKNVLSHSSIANNILFIDACRNDPAKSDAGTNRQFYKDDSSDGLAIMYSTGAGQLSWEDSEIEQGVFSYYLAKGIAGEAASKGAITFENLHKYVSTNVQRHVFARFDRRQTPYIAGERSGDFVLGKISLHGHNAKSFASGPTGLPRPASKWGWRRTALIFGTLALGALVAGSLSGENNKEQDSTITLVIPNP